VSGSTGVRSVYLFSETDDARAVVGDDSSALKRLLGGKGAGLAEMTRLGVPVPPGFTVTTEACNAFQEADALPDTVWKEQLAALERVEKATGKRFGSPEAPLLLSCRSGAPVSMPGMMDTVLNLGLDDDVVQGLARRTGDPRFAYDLYRRLVQMFSTVVLDVPEPLFEEVLTAQRARAGVASDAELSADDWRSVIPRFLDTVRAVTGAPFPGDPHEQLRRATEAVFRSWNGKRAIDYREAAGIPHDLGTAVNVQTMVFGNLDEESATGVAMSRNASSGAPELEGDFLMRAQGEDVVAGTRPTRPLAELRERMPRVYAEFEEIARALERHFRNMQDMEFTVESGKLWILQTRDGKRTAQAEVRIAVDMVDEGLISREEAVLRVRPDQVDFFLHPQLERGGAGEAKPLARGLNVSPGAAVGVVAFDADTACRWVDEGRGDVIMVRPETKPDDVHGMLAAKGVVTARGGRTSHAALVARQFGKPAVVGAEAIEIDLDKHEMRVGEVVVKEGEWISIDGTNGVIHAGRLPTVVPDLQNPHLLRILEWADGFRRLGVRANADYPVDAQRARDYGAEGIGLCRTEHMFFEADRIPIVQRMILAKSKSERKEAIAELLPYQRNDFAGLFRAMDGLPVIIRLLDPPLHEFLPSFDDLVRDLADLKVRLQHMHTLSEIDSALDEIRVKQDFLERVTALRESNPMLGSRGVRLGIQIPELTRMQVRAVFEAACRCAREGVAVRPEVMIPLVSHVNELEAQRRELEAEAKAVMGEQGASVEYRFGTMIEVPRAALTAGELARCAEFFSFGTNDLTQTTFGISRDDAEQGFLMQYLRSGILDENPFESIDPGGVGRLVELAVREGRAVRPDLEIGICGEHGGDPRSIALCQRLGLDYVSCSPYRVPIARLAAAHAVLAEKG